MKPAGRKSAPRLVARFVSISWRDLAVSFGPIVLVGGIALWLAIRLIQPAPPDTLTISAGPRGSTFWNTAQRYKTILARNGVTLDVLPSQGSLDNLAKLEAPDSSVDVGFVQDGVAPTPNNGNDEDDNGLVSLGSVAYVPLAVFYHGEKATRLSDFKGERLAIGTEGSGTRELALALLKANGIEPGGPSKLLPLSADAAAAALISGKVDAVFLTGDSAQPAVIGKLYRTPGVQFFDFTQADAYTRRFPWLARIDLPMGAFDLGLNLPPHPVRLVATTAELVARGSLHPALSDLLIEAAREVNGKATLLQRAGEFPAPLAHGFPISDDAARYYKSGKSFLYRFLPFWLASLADRLLVLALPLIVMLPALRLVPPLYAWRVRSRLYRWYGALIAIERGAVNQAPQERAALLARLDAIEASVNELKMPLSYANQFYLLREHIGFVRARLQAKPAPDAPDAAADPDADPGAAGPDTVAHAGASADPNASPGASSPALASADETTQRGETRLHAPPPSA